MVPYSAVKTNGGYVRSSLSLEMKSAKYLDRASIVQCPMSDGDYYSVV